MRRTAALLTVPLFLAVVSAAVYEPDPLGGWRSRATGQPVEGPALRARHVLDLIPLLLIGAACVGRSRPVQPLLQTLGGVWLAALWGLLLKDCWRIDSAFFDATPFLGMTLLSLLEAQVYPRRPAVPDPDRRFGTATLCLLALQESAQLAQLILSPFCPPFTRHFLLDWVDLSLLPLGTIATLLLTAWGLWQRARWAPWVGLTAAAGLLVPPLYEFIRVIALRPDLRERTLWFYFVGHFPRHLLLTTAAVLLARRLRRPRQEAAPAR